MADALLESLDHLMSSPWIYLALFGLAMLDGFFPMAPSESLVITAGAFAASGRPELLPVIAVAASGAFTGDHISYLIGRQAGGRWAGRWRPGGRRRQAYDWARRALARRGGLVLVAARYVPGGRTAVTMTMGSVGYPLRRFSRYDVLAAVTWGSYSGMIGFLGGLAFERDPLKGLAAGLGFALSLTVIVELARFWRSRRRARAVTSVAQPDEEEQPAALTATAV